MSTLQNPDPTTWTDAYLESKRFVTDAPADEAVTKLVAENGIHAAREVFDKLIKNRGMAVDELPPALQEFIQSHVDQGFPAWANLDLIKQAEEIFADHGPNFLTILFYKSLPTAYLCAKGAVVLVSTGRLSESEKKKQFKRRMGETGQFVMDIIGTESLRPGKAGMLTALKIRLVHAAVRNFIVHGEYDKAYLGKPINQEDMIMTLHSFSLMMMDALTTFGMPLSAQEEKAYLHAWNVTGYLMGVQEELLVPDPDNARVLLQKVLDRQAAPSEAGQILTRALIEFGEDLTPGKSLDLIPQQMVRFLIGETYAEYLGLTEKPGCFIQWLPHFVSKLLVKVERLEDRSESLDFILKKVNKFLLDGMIAYVHPDKTLKFIIDERLRAKWGV